MALDDLLIERSAVIVNSLGLHARPAGRLVKLAGNFSAAIEVGNDSMMVNARSILGVMMLAAECGSTLRIKASGPDAEQAVAALVELVEKGFED